MFLASTSSLHCRKSNTLIQSTTMDAPTPEHKVHNQHEAVAAKQVDEIDSYNAQLLHLCCDAITISR